MGMAATQARFLSLTARRSNIEFQGQQINQQRTTLSNESASYYSQLCNMAVPTPPSVDDYTKVSYTFNDGAMTNTITTMLTNPQKNSNAPYLLSYIQQWQDDYSPVEAASSFVSRTGSNGNYSYHIGSTELVKLASMRANAGETYYKAGKVSYTVKQDENGNSYIDRPDGSGTTINCNEDDIQNLKFALYNEADESISSISKSEYENYINGNASLDAGFSAVAYLFNDAETDSEYATQWVDFDGTNYTKEITYLSAAELENVYYGDDVQAQLKQEEAYRYLLNEKYNDGQDRDWYVRYVKDQSSGINVPYFYQESDLLSDTKFNTDNYANVRCYTIGSTTRTKEVLNQPGTVEKDSSGRYIAITLYEMDGDEIVNTMTYSLTTNTITDEAAYNDALNEYKYQQAQYDQKVQDLNSKLEIVQQQDKSLELNLKQLDTEEQAINTEIDAVTKIISKNVSESFGTFKGSA